MYGELDFYERIKLLDDTREIFGYIPAFVEMEFWNWEEAYVPLVEDIEDTFTKEILEYSAYEPFADNYYSNPLVDDLNARKVTFARLIDSLDEPIPNKGLVLKRKK